LARFLKPALNSAVVFAKLAQATVDSEPFTHPNVWRPHEAHRNYGNCDYEFASCGGCSRPCAAGSTKRQTGSRPKGSESRAAREVAEPATAEPRRGTTASGAKPRANRARGTAAAADGREPLAAGTSAGCQPATADAATGACFSGAPAGAEQARASGGTKSPAIRTRTC